MTFNYVLPKPWSDQLLVKYWCNCFSFLSSLLSHFWILYLAAHCFLKIIFGGRGNVQFMLYTEAVVWIVLQNRCFPNWWSELPNNFSKSFQRSWEGLFTSLTLCAQIQNKALKTWPKAHYSKTLGIQFSKTPPALTVHQDPFAHAFLIMPTKILTDRTAYIVILLVKDSI